MPMSELSYFTSKKGADCLTYDGYNFRKDNRSKEAWRCMTRNCLSKATTSTGEDGSTSIKITDHAHEPGRAVAARPVNALPPASGDPSAQKALTPTSPAPRRSKLSLKGSKNAAVQKLTPMFGRCDSPKEGSPVPVLSAQREAALPDENSKCAATADEAATQAEDDSSLETPCVAALHNLGNTCFLSSVLQVLRYSPGFITKIQALAKEIRISEKEKSLISELQGDDSDDEEDEILTWRLVKNLQDLFKRMASVEDKFSREVTRFITIRPWEVLDTIERLNPMFQGNLQQDAHELLLCMLAYIQDAAKEVNKYRKSTQENAVATTDHAVTTLAVKPETAIEGACDGRLVGCSDTAQGSVAPAGEGDASIPVKEELSTTGEFHQASVESELSSECNAASVHGTGSQTSADEKARGIHRSAKYENESDKENSAGEVNAAGDAIDAMLRKLPLGSTCPSQEVRARKCLEGTLEEDLRIPVEMQLDGVHEDLLFASDDDDDDEVSFPNHDQKRRRRNASGPVRRKKGLNKVQGNSMLNYMQSPQEKAADRMDVGACSRQTNGSVENGSGDGTHVVTPTCAGGSELKAQSPANGKDGKHEGASTEATTARKSRPRKRKVDENEPEPESTCEKTCHGSSEVASKSKCKSASSPKIESEPRKKSLTRSKKPAGKPGSSPLSGLTRDNVPSGTNTVSSAVASSIEAEPSNQPSITSLFAKQGRLSVKRLGLTRNVVSIYKRPVAQPGAVEEGRALQSNGSEEVPDAPSEVKDMGAPEGSCKTPPDGGKTHNVEGMSTPHRTTLPRSTPSIYRRGEPCSAEKQTCNHGNGADKSVPNNDSAVTTREPTEPLASREELGNRTAKVSKSRLSRKKEPVESRHAVVDVAPETRVQPGACTSNRTPPRSTTEDTAASLPECTQDKPVIPIIVATVRPFTGRTPTRKQTAKKSVRRDDRGVVDQVDEDDLGTEDDQLDHCADEHGSPDVTEKQMKSEAVSPRKKAVVKLEPYDITKYFGKVIKPRSMAEIARTTHQVEDCVEQLFQGTMALRTRCLECEGFTQRKEEYQDISLAVRKEGQAEKGEKEDEDDEDEDDPIGWIRSSLEDVERLRDDNKYFCERCARLVEAERSVKYVTVPHVLTLHLKRFAMMSRYVGGFTKITDHVSTPFHMPCIEEKCPDPRHGNELYAVITHTGFSLSAGHYVAYVKAPSDSKALEHPAWEGNPSTEASMLEKTVAPSGGGSEQHPQVLQQGQEQEDDMADPNNNQDANNNVGETTENKNVAAASKGESRATSDAPTVESSSSLPSDDATWFEFDDEVVTLLSQKEFEEKLSPGSSTSPYLLFYRQIRSEQ